MSDQLQISSKYNIQVDMLLICVDVGEKGNNPGRNKT